MRGTSRILITRAGTLTVTLDRYGHLMPGNEREAAGMLAEYLRREFARG